MRRWLVPVLVAAALPGSAAAFTNPQIPGLQVALRAHGYDPGPIDGIVGPKTAGAVRAFQARNGIRADGLAGPRTRARLGRLGRPLFGARTLARGRIGWDVSVLQFLLARCGFATTHLNGNFGRGTERGVLGSLDRWAAHYGVDPHLARALAWMESGFQPTIRSPIGAWGVMQVTPATWDYAESVLIGMPIPRTADGNVRIGLAYLHHLLRAFGGNERLALAAYYQGPASVRKRGLLRETKAFVADVQALKQRM
jgi:soluble lytic murein transglycosylase-like protein